MMVLGAVDLPRACDYAANVLGADPASLSRFIHYWDGDGESNTGQLQQLDELWQERLTDAEAVQDVCRLPRNGPSVRQPREATHFTTGVR
jgi:hypothetical protein